MTNKFFSVKFAVKIGDERYAPAVCYPLDESLEPVIKKLVEKGDAKMYTDKVRFVNGSPLPVKKNAPAAPKQPVGGGISTPVRSGGGGSYDVKRKKVRRDFE